MKVYIAVLALLVSVAAAAHADQQLQEYTNTKGGDGAGQIELYKCDGGCGNDVHDAPRVNPADYAPAGKQGTDPGAKLPSETSA